MHQDLKLFQSKLGYKFNKEEWLIQALSHPSLNHKNRKTDKNFIKNYERLEFLGDSILNFVISKRLFVYYRDKNEGDLAKRRAHLISGNIICQISERLEIANYIIMTEGEEKSGGRANQGNIENAFEAICAAIYLDSQNFETIENFILNFWNPLINEEYKDYKADPKSALQEKLQSMKLPLASYNIISVTGESHQPIFEIEVKVENFGSEVAYGKTKKEAEKEAASLMLKRLQ